LPVDNSYHRSGADNSSRVFNVNIVSPFEERTPLKQKTVKPPPKKSEPVIIKKRLRPPEKTIFSKRRPTIDNTLMPDTLDGTGSYLSPKSGEKQAGRKKADEQVNVKPGHTTDQPSISAKEEPERIPVDKDGIIPGGALFDEGTIAKYARRGPPAQRGLSFSTPGFKHRGYLRMLKERIESVWKYPKEAAERGISGDLYLVITINRDGSLADIELLRTSGFIDLDESAMKALKKAFPWAALPEDYNGDKLKITGHFIYVYGNAYAM
jgi:TonB family protein